MKQAAAFLALSLLTPFACSGRVDSSAAPDAGGAGSGGSIGVGGSVSTGGAPNLGGLTASGGSVSVGGSSGSGGSPLDAAADAPFDAGPCECPTTVPENGTPCCKFGKPPLNCLSYDCPKHESTGFGCDEGIWYVNLPKPVGPCPDSGP
ncbi:MAG: hypothetical protein KF718_15610 [Polyangiaceae bacterium]|nr:hypothetical protein [Polyangiaceae bacterium]